MSLPVQLKKYGQGDLQGLQQKKKRMRVSIVPKIVEQHR